MTEAYVLGGVRTPFTRYGGSLSTIRADDLLGMTMKGACDRLGVPLGAVEDIAAGCVNPAHEGMGDVARWAALAAGFPDTAAGVTMNRFCGSSLSAAVTISHAIKAGDLGLGIACGVESMSRSGWALMKGDAAGGPPNPMLLARNAYISMIETAQNVANRYSLNREEIDAYALRSQQRAKAARDRGRLAKEIMPVTIPATKNVPARLAEHDEFIRDDTTAEVLAALPVQPGTTQMTAANSSPLSDGASAVVLASEERARELGVEPLARVVSSAVYGIDPLIMGVAPAWAIPAAIRRAGLVPEQIDVWEVHEAFSAQALGVLRELPNQLDGFVVPDDKLTPNGGAVAIGHPFGATGTRYLLTLATELRERSARYGVIGVCIGSGQAVAVVLEAAAGRAS